MEKIPLLIEDGPIYGDGLADQEAVTAIVTFAAGNFWLIDRLMAKVIGSRRLIRSMPSRARPRRPREIVSISEKTPALSNTAHNRSGPGHAPVTQSTKAKNLDPIVTSGHQQVHHVCGRYPEQRAAPPAMPTPNRAYTASS